MIMIAGDAALSRSDGKFWPGRRLRDYRLFAGYADWLVRGVQDPVLLHLRDERPSLQAERLGRGVAVSSGLPERLDDHAPLDVGQSFLERGAGPDPLRQVDDPVRRRRGQQEVLRSDDVALGEDNRPLDRILELADVARPIVAIELLDRQIGDLRRGSARREAVLVEEVLDQERNVVFTLTQRRHVDRD